MSKLIDDAKRQNRKVTRFSTGVFALDVCYGGGFPRGRPVLVVGKESTGKTAIGLKVAESISKVDWETGEFGGFTKTLFIDMEGTFDIDWATRNGWHPENDVVLPDDGDHGADIISEAMRSGEYGLIIADSLDCFYPSKLQEKAQQDGGLPGARAKLLNESFVKWTSILRKLDVPPHKMPSMYFINQYRLTMGVMHGDPRVIPGGEGQRFYSSIITSMKSAKVEDACGVESAVVTFSGSTAKNKTYLPKKTFEFQMGLADTEDLKTGEINNVKSVMKVLQQRAIQKVKSKYQFLGEEYGTQKEITTRMTEDAKFFDLCWKTALSEVFG